MLSSDDKAVAAGWDADVFGFEVCPLTGPPFLNLTALVTAIKIVHVAVVTDFPAKLGVVSEDDAE